MSRDIWKVNERRKLVPIISEGLLVQDLLHLHFARLIEEGLRLRRAVSHLRPVFRIEIIIIAGTVLAFYQFKHAVNSFNTMSRQDEKAPFRASCEYFFFYFVEIRGDIPKIDNREFWLFHRVVLHWWLL